MISVIIPVYNVENYLDDCLQSVLNQTYTDLEIICIDDYSTDSSLELLEYYGRLDNRIKILKNNKNKGLGYCRNKGLKYAKGKYILFLDSDDWIGLKTIETLYNISEKKQLELLMFKAINFDDEKNIFYRTEYYSMTPLDKYTNKIFNYDDLNSNELLSLVVSAWNKLYLKSFLCENDLKFPIGLIHEDNPFFYELLSKVHRMSLINEYLYKRRRRAESITTNNNEIVLDAIPIMYKCFNISINQPQIYNKHKIAIINRIFERLNVKYNFIADEFKEEFYKNTQNFIITICSEHFGVWKDINNNLNDENSKFFQFLGLTIDNTITILFNNTFNKKYITVALINQFLIKLLNFDRANNSIIKMFNLTLNLFKKNNNYSKYETLYVNEIFSTLLNYLLTTGLDNNTEFFQQIKEDFLIFTQDNEFNTSLNKKNKELFNQILNSESFEDFNYHARNI